MITMECAYTRTTFVVFLTATLFFNVPVSIELFEGHLATFVSTDPLRLNTNVYEFVNNDPINTLDRNGLCPICGAGNMCILKYSTANNGFNIDEAINHFAEQFNLTLPQSHMILLTSNYEHHLKNQMAPQELRFSDDLKLLSRRMVELRKSYVNQFPERFRTVIGHSPFTGDLALLQPLKFVSLAEERNLPLTLWKRTHRNILRERVPSLYEWSMESISNTEGFRRYASRFDEEMREFNLRLASTQNEALAHFRALVGEGATLDQIQDAIDNTYRNIQGIDPRIRFQINSDNPTLRAEYDFANRRPLTSYFAFRRNAPMGPNERAASYFPEMTMGLNRSNTMASWYFPRL